MIFITADDVAESIGFANGPAFLRARDRLEAENDFPRPMPTCLRPLKWRRDEVETWVTMQGQSGDLPTPVITGTNVVLLAEARRA